MECWFTTSRGETLHNNPSTKDYVLGEPPLNSNTCREECLNKGFARVGWPNTGDLRPDHLGEGRLAKEGYSYTTLSKNQKKYLLEFSNILAGDLIIIPADDGRGVVHLGIVLSPEKKFYLPDSNHRPKAYYYYHNIPSGDYYECAHRVNVKWAQYENGDYVKILLAGLGIWRYPFRRVVQEKENILKYALKYKVY